MPSSGACMDEEGNAEAPARARTGGRFADLRSRWESRAAECQDAPVGVLFRGLAPALNQYLHRFHARVVCDRLLPLLAPGASVLDLGCGYGRIGQEMLSHRPDLLLTGVDFAWPYCRRYRLNVAASVCADAARLPFAAGSFDAIVAVTVLMYVPPALRPAMMSQLIPLLKPGGQLLMVEPAQEVLEIIARLRPASAGHTTGGSGFGVCEFRSIAGPEIRVLDAGGMPAFTAMLPVLQLLNRFPRGQAPMLALLERLDDQFRAWNRWSLHRWLLGQRMS